MPRLNSLNSYSGWPHISSSAVASRRLTKLPASSSFFIIDFESMVYPIKGWPQTMGSVDRMVTHGPKSAKLAGGHDVSAWTNTPTSLELGAAEAVMSPHPIAHTNTTETTARLFMWGSLLHEKYGRATPPSTWKSQRHGDCRGGRRSVMVQTVSLVARTIPSVTALPIPPSLPSRT